MKLRNVALLLSLLFLLAPIHGNAAGSMLRVTCEGDDVGAEVLINGQFKGECPMDIQVPAGTSKLLVQKKVGKEDRVFEQDIRMGDGGVKKVEVKLVDKWLSSTLKEAQAGDPLALLRVVVYYSYQKPRNNERVFFWTLKRAEAGDPASMQSIAESYSLGQGVQKDEDEANRWYRRAFETAIREAESGNVNAMLTAGHAYALGKGVPEDRVKAAMWFHRAKDKGEKFADKFLEMYELR